MKSCGLRPLADWVKKEMPDFRRFRSVILIQAVANLAAFGRWRIDQHLSGCFRRSVRTGCNDQLRGLRPLVIGIKTKIWEYLISPGAGTPSAEPPRGIKKLDKRSGEDIGKDIRKKRSGIRLKSMKYRIRITNRFNLPEPRPSRPLLLVCLLFEVHRQRSRRYPAALSVPASASGLVRRLSERYTDTRNRNGKSEIRDRTKPKMNIWISAYRPW